MQIPKIYLNPGHSDKDPGAVGYEVERKLAVKVVQYEREHLLENYICEVRMNPVTMGNLYEICEDANKWGADLFDSTHFNAGKGDGYEALVNSEARRELGEIYEKHIKAIGQNSRGVKIRPGLAVLRDTKMAAIINECAFVDNLQDIEDWNDDAELKLLGIAQAKAAAEFLKLDKKVSKPKVKTNPVDLPALTYGVKDSASVKSLQILLKGLGYNVSSTGNFGDGTRTALKKYQTANKIPVTGVADAATWEALLGLK